MQALDSVADDVVVKDGEPSQLDSAVLACANIDLYSHPRSKLRAKSSRVAISGLQSIAETKVVLSTNSLKPLLATPVATHFSTGRALLLRI